MPHHSGNCVLIDRKMIERQRGPRFVDDLYFFWLAYFFTPAASAKPSDIAGGIVLAGGGSAKVAFLALIALE